jgi:hypothetical protein
MTKSKNKILFVLIVLVGFHLYLVSSESAGLKNEHEGHHEHRFEFGLSTGITFIQPESESAIGFHLHAMHRLGEEGLAGLFGLGLGLEMIFSQNIHYNFMASLGIYPLRHIEITLSPGILFVEEEGEAVRKFSFHIEVNYLFDLLDFEIGPAVAYSIAGEDTHITLGIHIGKGF